MSSLHKYQSLVLPVKDLLGLCINILTDDDFYEVTNVKSFKVDLVSLSVPHCASKITLAHHSFAQFSLMKE